MKRNLNIFEKLMHYAEDTTTGIIEYEHEHETKGDYIRPGTANLRKNRRQYKHLSKDENCTANKRKAKP